MRPLDERYFEWLYKKALPQEERDFHQSGWDLLKLMYCTEFVWIIDRDDNRAEDGKTLRLDFVRECRYEHPDANWMDMPCSFLEMMVAICLRGSFFDDRDVSVWFWELIGNLDLHDYTRFPAREFEEVARDKIETVIWRKYSRSGLGGLFPLSFPDRDQTKIELWAQLTAYIQERQRLMF